MIDRPERISVISGKPVRQGPVLYWMSRDQRVHDNWSLFYALQKAAETRSALHVVFSVAGGFLSASERQFDFMLKGLQETEKALHRFRIPFHLLSGCPTDTVPVIVRDLKAGLLVCDFDPLGIKQEWVRTIAECVDIAMHEVDAHNIVPCRTAYPERAAFAARVIRRPIMSRLHGFLSEYPAIPVQDYPEDLPDNDWDRHFHNIAHLEKPGPVPGIRPGYSAGMTHLDRFIHRQLNGYEASASNPEADNQSGLSIYLHFGQISAQRVALEVLRAGYPESSAFLEQLIVRRELSDNWCLHTPKYDTTAGFPEWARKTLDAHRHDPRLFLYSMTELENAVTHDPLWNTAQREMVWTGKMHGYLRMYWAKKILEWMPDPETAHETAIHLNDRYSIDGRDPNGYAGIAWSIGGVHDRPWSERPVFGKIRYMSDRGAMRKFDIGKYIDRVERRIAFLVDVQTR